MWERNMIFTINGLKDKKFMIISKKVFFSNLLSLRDFHFSGTITDLYFYFFRWMGLWLNVSVQWRTWRSSRLMPEIKGPYYDWHGSSQSNKTKPTATTTTVIVTVITSRSYREEGGKADQAQSKLNPHILDLIKVQKFSGYQLYYEDECHSLMPAVEDILKYRTFKNIMIFSE